MKERDLLNMLHRRYGAMANNNPRTPIERRARRYVVAEHVPTRPFGPAHILDAVVVDTWQSGRLSTHGFELKCNRSDWLAERRNPWKADAWAQWLDFFWLVVADSTVLRIQPDEVPDSWGILRAHGGRLVVDREAQRQTDGSPNWSWQPNSMPWEMTVALLRAAARNERVRTLATLLDGAREAGYADV